MSKTSRRFLVGDPISHLVVPAVGGKHIDFWHQERAGRIIVLVLARSIEDVRPSIVDAQGLLLPTAALIAVVLPTPPSASEVLANLLVLLDPADELASAFGVQPPAIVVIGADTRLKSALPGHNLSHACALVDRLHRATSDDHITAQAPVALVEEVFEPQLCRRLISF